MKKIILIITLLISFNSLYSQPVISYIIPDIGTPGMNTYVEFIGLYNRSGNFGSDGFYLNNQDSEVRIIFVNPEDSAKISFGPLVLSWDGRMISTQVFVHSGVNPNSDDWQKLDPQFKIPIRVQRGASLSNVDTFYIVKPMKLGDVRSIPDRVIGNATTLGKRSRRGAMLVDSLILPDGDFSVSTDDVDPNSDGNQGYLPFFLLSKGNIHGSANTKIIVDGVIRHGGPGGGGGGGRFYDGTSPFDNEIGDDGGNGFTSGGPGGRNYSSLGNNDKFKSLGTGTGADGKSLNGVLPSYPEWYESAGGGTGHPFGFSGYGCNGGNSCDPDGGYGGGSGGQQSSDGAGGGNASDGGNSTPKNAGKMHGNIYIVPFYGGSGGASGNPSGSPGRMSGSGGGGGGAIDIFAPSIKNIILSAKGGSGGKSNYSNANGGGGSGGSASLQAKIDVSSIKILLDGGATGKLGGAGRARYDIPLPSQITQIEIQNSAAVNNYQGLSSDTNHFVKRNFKLRITARPGFYKLRTFIKPHNGQWTEGNEGLDTDNDGVVYVDVSLPAPDTVFYFTAIEEIANPSKKLYNVEPKYVMSQAAANFFLIDMRPIICGDTVKTDTITSCPGDFVLDSFRICNKGNDILNLMMSTAEFKNKIPGFSIVAPNVDTDVMEGDTTTVYIRYDNLPGVYGLQTDTLIIDHNDSLSGKKPWKFTFSVYVKKIDLEFQDLHFNKIDTIDLGTYCINSQLDSSFIIKNLSEINIKSIITQLGNSLFLVNPKEVLIGTVTSDDTSLVKVSIFGSELGEHFATLLLSSEECPMAFDTLVLKANFVTTDIKFTSSGNFGTVMLGDKKTIDVFLENIGDQPAYIQKINTPDTPFQITNIDPALPLLLLPGESITITLTFTPVDVGEFKDSLFAESLEINGSCIDRDTIEIIGMASGNKLRLEKDTIDFGLHPYCKTMTDSVKIYNFSFSNVSIIEAKIKGNNASDFRIIQPQPPAPKEIKAKDSITYYILFDPADDSDGASIAELQFITGETGEDSLLTVVLIGKSEQPDIDISPNPINIGSFPIGETINRQFEIINNGSFDYILNSISTSSTDASINPSSNVTITAKAGRSTFDLSVNITKEGPFEIFAYIDFADPCPHRDTITIRGNGLSGEIAYSDKIDYGVLPWCKDSIMTVFFWNTGLAPVKFLEMQAIAGADNSLFSFYDDVYPAPIPNSELTSGDTLFRQIRFDPSKASTDGIKYAHFITKFLVNAKEVEYRTELQGERRSGIVVAPSNIWFGSIVKGTSTSQRVKIKNNGKTTITLYEIQPFNLPNIFSVVPPSINKTLNPGDSIEFIITFFAEEDIDYTDNFVINLLVDGVDCGSEIRVTLTAGGTPPKVVHVWMPEITVSPDIDDYHIPIYAGLEKEEDYLKNISFRATIHFNSSIYYPVSVSNGTLSRSFDGTETTVTIVVDSTDINGTSSVLTELIGPTALANRKSYPLVWNEIQWLSPNLVNKTTYKDGSITIEICEAGGERLLDFGKPVSLIISPNPVNDRLNIDLHLLESGEYRLEIVSLEGRAFPLERWNVPNDSLKDYNLSFDADCFASGMYYLILRSPAKVYCYPLMIVK